MKSVLIAGCGALGNGLGQLLHERDDSIQVFGIRRNVTALHPCIQGIKADLSQPASLKDLPAVDALVYTATPSERTESAYRVAYVDGLKAVLNALPQIPSRFIYVSSTSVLADSAGAWVDETTAAKAESETAAVLLEAEAVALAHQAVVLRFAGIYGPARRWLLRSAEQAVVECDVDPPQWTNRIHEYDCVQALWHLLHSNMNACVLHGVDDEPAARYDVLAWLRQQMNLPAPVPSANPLRDKATGKRIKNQRLRAIGWVPRYPSFREGYQEILSQVGK